MTIRGVNWCFTINNYTDADVERLTNLADECKYLIFGKETGSNGTPHLQGFVTFKNRYYFTRIKEKVGINAHVEPLRGKAHQAADYCKKDGVFTEFGSVSTAGQRSDLETCRKAIHDFTHDNGRPPSRKELAIIGGTNYIRYSKGLMEYACAIAPTPKIHIQPDLFAWQKDLAADVTEIADPRQIVFIVDTEGARGKTFFTTWQLSEFPDKVQLLGVCKRDDTAHLIDETKERFYFNVPRGSMEHLRYEILEMLKDQVVFSPKYDSRVKFLAKVPHVIVFSNEYPNMEKLSHDRYKIIDLTQTLN